MLAIKEFKEDEIEDLLKVKEEFLQVEIQYQKSLSINLVIRNSNQIYLKSREFATNKHHAKHNAKYTLKF